MIFDNIIFERWNGQFDPHDKHFSARHNVHVLSDLVGCWAGLKKQAEQVEDVDHHHSNG